MITPASDGSTARTLTALQSALGTRSRDAFTALLTDDVHWGGKHGGNQCTTRAEAGDHYARLLAEGLTLDVASLRPSGDTVTAVLTITAPDAQDHPREVTVRMTLRGELIADILELDPPPQIEVLYFDECPNHDTFLPHLRQLLIDHGIAAPITLTRVEDDDDAQARRFLGSPTLRVNGIDVEPAAADRHSYALQCRRYATPDGYTGAPPDQWIIDALTDSPDIHALIDAIRTGDVAALHQVLALRPELATSRLVRHGGRTPLHIATDWPGQFPHVADTINILAIAGADPNISGVGEHPETPLHWAASSGDLEALDALLDAGG